MLPLLLSSRINSTAAITAKGKTSAFNARLYIHPKNKISFGMSSGFVVSLAYPNKKNFDDTIFGLEWKNRWGAIFCSGYAMVLRLNSSSI